jgi:hypothetical protein
MKLSFESHPFWRRLFGPCRWVLFILLFSVALRLALPFVVKAYVNHVLNGSEDYSGKIGGVEMKLLRGGYRIDQIQIFQKTKGVETPLFSAPRMDLSIEWRELFHGAVVGEIILHQPQVSFSASLPSEEVQNGKNQSWDKTLQSLFPFKLNRFEIDDGEIHFKNSFSQPPVDIYLNELSLTATNLTNARDSREKLPSGIVAGGSTLGGGELNLQLHMDLLKATPTYEMNCGLTNVNLVALNDFLRAYGKFDVARGTFALFMSVAAENGAYEGYFKVFFKNLDVFQWEKERKKNILAIFWQAIVGGVATILENHPKDQLATKVPISGSYTNSSVGIWTAAGTLLQNAFIHALVPKLDQQVTVEQVEKTEEKK